MMKGETGDDGTAKFTDLKDGIYLVVQTGSSGKAKDFTNVQPFLVIIPQFENGIQNRVVNAKPKTEIQRKEKPEITSTNTTGIYLLKNVLKQEILQICFGGMES